MNNNITTLLAVETFVQEHTKEIRGERVLTDQDVALLYEVSLAEVHRVVARNTKRFPSDFMFLLNDEEKGELSLTKEKVYAFTWGGILMLGGQMKSDRAIRTHMQMIELLVDRMNGKVFELLSDIQNPENEL